MVGWISTAQAADPLCNCFCTDPRGGGVRDVGGKKDFSECETFCKSQESKIVVCAQSFSQLPSNSLRCFTEEQCTAQNGYLDSEQAPECPTGMTLCLPNDVPVNLIVSVPVNEEAGGMVGTVNNIGDYINTMYKFLLWAGGAFAIIMLMAGGLQYVLSSGTGNVKQAQGRIRQAVIGLVLLMGAYVILLTINPNLVKLSLPKLPLVKRVEFVGQGSCDTMLQSANTKLENMKGEPVTSGRCGDMAKVITTPEGGKPPDGTTCQFIGCPGSQSCLGTGGGAVCTSCGNFVAPIAQPNEQKLAPSENLCRRLSGDPQFDGKKNLLSRDLCFFSVDADLTGTIAGNDYTLTQSDKTCAVLELRCEDIDDCGDYENIRTFNRIKSETLEDINPGNDLITVNSQNLETICSSNPCLWHIRQSRPDIKGCRFELQENLLYATFTGNHCVNE